ncbi:MAG: RcpC/CpaB family pilus assembly protein [Streptosporangiaceae bacterium]
MKRRILTIGLAVLLAVFGTAGVLAYVHQSNVRALAGHKAVSVLVAAKEIPSGTSARAALAEGLVSSQTLPASSVPSDAVRSITASLAALVTSAAIAPGQLLLLPMLVTVAQTTSGMAIPAGMEAVTLQLCLTETVADSIHAGSEVAVYDTYSSSGTLTAQPNCSGPHQQQDAGAVHTRIVLPKVLVLSVGESAAGQASSSATSTAFSQSSSAPSAQGTVMVTFAVFQDNAERLIQLSEAGLPYLALLTSSSQTRQDNSVVPQFPPLSGAAANAAVPGA